MSITNVGTVSVGGALPGVISVKGQLDGIVALDLPALQIDIAKFTADISAFQAELTSLATLGADFSVQLNAQLAIVAGLQATIALGPAALIAQLVVQVTAPSFLVGLQAAGPSLLASIQGSLTTALGLSASLGAKLSVNVALIAQVTARIADFQLRLSAALSRLPTLQAGAAFSLNFAAQLAQAGVTVLLYQGALSGMNSVDYAAAVGGAISPTTQVWAPIFITGSSATFAALQVMVKTS